MSSNERTIEQAYCMQCGMFLPDRYIRGKCHGCGAINQYGDSCEVCSTTYNPRDLIDPHCANCGTGPQWRASEHSFFRLSNFSDRLRDWVRSGHVQEEIANKLQEWFDAGLQDWDISRDAPYFGFEIPGKPGKYFYVWLDAPVGYMASTMDWCRRNGADFDSYWRNNEEAEVYHFIGKDIVYFHALFWPAMLMGSGFRTPTQLCVHGFLTVDRAKMSKSRGTYVTAETYLKFLDPQYLRYYYAAKLNSHVEDLDLSVDDLIQRVNADLVNKIANIPSRILAILHRNCESRLSTLDENGRQLVARLRARSDQIAGYYEAREFCQVTRSLCDMTGEINGYLQEHRPWELVKEDRQQTAAVCTAALNAFKILAILIAPILPEFANKVARMLKLSSVSWDDLDTLLENQPVEPYERLVDRVDRVKVEAMISASVGSSTETEVERPAITLDPLVDCDFRSMRLTEAQPVAGSNRLLALELESGEEHRTLVAGLGHEAADGRLTGKSLLVLANLEPKTIGACQSHGMILAAKVNGAPIPVLVVDESGTELE